LVDRAAQKAAGIHRGVAQKFKQCAVKRICPRFNGGVNDRASAAAKFRRVVACLDFEFFYRIDVGSKDVSRIVI
jgi:hypothetical protein